VPELDADHPLENYDDHFAVNGLAGGAIGPDMKMTHLLKWVGQIGMDYKTTLPSHNFGGVA